VVAAGRSRSSAIAAIATARRATTPILRTIGLLAAGVAIGAILAAVSSRFIDMAPVAILVLGAGPVVMVLVLLHPMIGVVTVFASFAIGLQVALTVGPLNVQVVEAVILLVALLIAIQRILRGHPPLSWSWPLSWALGFVVWAGLAALYALDPGAAAKQVGSMAYGLGFAAVVLSVCRDMTDVKRLLASFVAVAALTTLVALPAIDALRSEGASGIIRGRPVGIFTHPNELGAFCALATMAAVGLAFGSRTRRGRVAASACLVVLLAGLLASLSRGAWLGALAGIVMLVVTLPRVRRVVIAASVPVLIVAALLGSFAGTAPQVRIVGERLSALTARQPYDSRPDIWAEAVRQMREDPWTGVGPANFGVASERRASSAVIVSTSHAHNQFLNIGAEWGLPGLAMFVCFVVALGIVTRRGLRATRAPGRFRDRAIVAAVGAALLTRLVQGVVDTVLGNPVIDAAMWGLTGALLGAYRVLARRTPAPAGEPAPEAVPAAGPASGGR
jgi:O-antigen ligase